MGAAAAAYQRWHVNGELQKWEFCIVSYANSGEPFTARLVLLGEAEVLRKGVLCKKCLHIAYRAKEYAYILLLYAYNCPLLCNNDCFRLQTPRQSNA